MLENRRKRGQVSLEFLFVFTILIILLAYSVKNTTFETGSPSTDTLGIQIAIEEKSLANSISNVISQVYSQGPGSKTTVYLKLNLLRKSNYIEKALDLSNPVIFITYGPYYDKGNGTYVTLINGSGTTSIYLSGGNKNVFWSRSLYQKDLMSNSSVWPASATINMNGTTSTVYGIMIRPSEVPPEVKIVVEWNPEIGDRWLFDSTKGELLININPGG